MVPGVEAGDAAAGRGDQVDSLNVSFQKVAADPGHDPGTDSRSLEIRMHEHLLQVVVIPVVPVFEVSQNRADRFVACRDDQPVEPGCVQDVLESLARCRRRPMVIPGLRVERLNVQPRTV